MSSPASRTRPSSSAAHPPSLPAQAIAFDPTDDIAMLRVPDLGRAVAAASCANRPRVPPARSSAIPRTAPSTCSRDGSGAPRRCSPQNAYGQGPVSRLLTPLRGLVRPGNSGGPLVDGSGACLTTVFAGTVGGGPAGGYGVANATVAQRWSLADAGGRRAGLAPVRCAVPGEAYRGRGPGSGLADEAGFV